MKISIHGYFSWFWKATAIIWQKILLYQYINCNVADRYVTSFQLWYSLLFGSEYKINHDQSRIWPFPAGTVRYQPVLAFSVTYYYKQWNRPILKLSWRNIFWYTHCCFTTDVDKYCIALMFGWLNEALHLTCRYRWTSLYVAFLSANSRICDWELSLFIKLILVLSKSSLVFLYESHILRSLSIAYNEVRLYLFSYLLKNSLKKDPWESYYKINSSLLLECWASC